MSDIRIKDLPETLDVESDDYVAVDNAGDGTRKYTLRQLIASVGAPEFVVNINASGEADKTLSEITSAIASGYVPVAVYNDEYYQLTKTTETSATFTKYNELGEMVSITVSGDFVLVEETPLTTDNITNHSGVTGENVSYALDELSYNIGYLSDRVNDTVNSVSGMRDDIEALDSRVTDLEASSGGGSGTGLTPTEKNLILTLFAKAAYAEDDADNYYTQLESLWDTSDRTFTYNLTNCIIDNPISTIAYGNRYTGVIGVQQGYSLNSVTITMGGVDITATSYSSGTVTIPSVTGNVAITATAVLAAQSITATYTQSGTVYDTDSLETLRNDLVVTANYAGGTSETVTDYTLSGTLTEGTSVITVTYAGLTDTFNVTVSGQPISDETKWTDGVAYTYTGVLNEYVDRSNGSLVAYNAWDRTTYLYCSGASTLTFDCVTSNSQGGASNLLYNAFYDADKNFLSAFSLSTNMSTAGNTADVTVPSGAVYFVASGKQSLYAYRDNTGGPFVRITPKA